MRSIESSAWDAAGAKPRLRIVRDGWTGNLHALAVLTHLPAGATRFRLALRGPARKPVAVELRTADGVFCRTFRTVERVRTYLWRGESVSPALFPIKVPAGSPARLRYPDGSEERTGPDGVLQVWLEDRPQRCFATLLGEAPAELGGGAQELPCRPLPVTPFVRAWRVSRVLTGVGSLAQVACPGPGVDLGWHDRRYADDFADLHEVLTGADTAVFLACGFHCAEAMRLRLGVGYDGPVRVWVDGEALLDDPTGTNPAFWDRARVPYAATPGAHHVTIALGSNGGKAWGIFFRIERTDIEPLHPSSLQPLPSLRS